MVVSDASGSVPSVPCGVQGYRYAVVMLTEWEGTESEWKIMAYHHRNNDLVVIRILAALAERWKAKWLTRK